MKTKFKLTYLFEEEDLEGCGQYVIRVPDLEIKDDGYLVTVLEKVGYLTGGEYCLISMADGWVNRKGTKLQVVEYLNDNEYRPATLSEVIRAMRYSSNRCINNVKFTKVK